MKYFILTLTPSSLSLSQLCCTFLSFFPQCRSRSVSLSFLPSHFLLSFFNPRSLLSLLFFRLFFLSFPSVPSSSSLSINRSPFVVCGSLFLCSLLCPIPRLPSPRLSISPRFNSHPELQSRLIFWPFYLPTPVLFLFCSFKHIHATATSLVTKNQPWDAKRFKSRPSWTSVTDR